MTITQGSKLLTIDAIAGETYRIEYESGYTVNILNCTDDDITVSVTQTEISNESFRNEITLPAKAFYYGLNSRLDKTLYITAAEDGKISVIRTDRDGR